jgi:hypothetical protein
VRDLAALKSQPPPKALTCAYFAGRYLAEITREVFSDLETAKYTLAEYRLSIYGRCVCVWRTTKR